MGRAPILFVDTMGYPADRSAHTLQPEFLFESTRDEQHEAATASSAPAAAGAYDSPARRGAPARRGDHGLFPALVALFVLLLLAGVARFAKASPRARWSRLTA